MVCLCAHALACAYLDKPAIEFIQFVLVRVGQVCQVHCQMVLSSRVLGWKVPQGHCFGSESLGKYISCDNVQQVAAKGCNENFRGMRSQSDCMFLVFRRFSSML